MSGDVPKVDKEALETLAIEWMFYSSHFGVYCEIVNGRWSEEQIADMGRGVISLLHELRDLREPREPGGHLAYVEADIESFRRGGSCRRAACLCGWKGPERATLTVAADDAGEHERLHWETP